MRDRCATCGGRLITWSPTKIIEAAQWWAAEHGAQPTSIEWKRASVDHPDLSTAIRAFGSWNAMIAAAGFVPHPAGAGRTPSYSREDIKTLIFEWCFAHGRLPTWRDWVEAPRSEIPHPSVVARLFGSWNAGIVAAGYEPTVKYRTAVGYRHQAGMASRERDALGRLVAA